jgi:cell division septum initiation protein DivIVA
LAEQAKGRADLLKNATEKEQQIVDLKQELKEVCEAATAEKKRLEDELAEERRKVVEATVQFNTTLLVG